jgi:tRNA A-37 threonylcarbamoyl transferase component Bud32
MNIFNKKVFLPYGYTYKKFANLKITVSDKYYETCSDSSLKDMCVRLFSLDSSDNIRKEGAYKTILTATFNNTPCIVKKYRNKGFFRRVKSLFFPSRAMNEFNAAVSIHNKKIPTAPPLFMAETGKWKFITESLVCLSFLSEAIELRDVFFNLRNFSLCEKNKILEDFGMLTANIFLRGIFQNDYSLNNFMIRKEEKNNQIYFIDFERVIIKDKLSETEKLLLIAKLNRVGREVKISDRMRFLRGYLRVDPGLAKNVKSLALKLQQKTVMLLKKDLKRCRLTSIHTHANYDRIKKSGYTGLYKKGYDQEDIISRIKNIPDGSAKVNLPLKFMGADSLLSAVQFKGHEAEKVWSILSALIIAGLAIELPHILVKDENRGFIMVRPEAYENPSPACCQSLRHFIKENFSEEVDKVKSFIGDI